MYEVSRKRGDNAKLTAAYTAKRAKELSAANALFSPHAMQSAYDRARAGVAALERKLDRRGARWLYSDEPTLADLFWGVELLRMKNVGVAHFWQDGRLPEVERFAEAIERIPAIRSSVIEWPGALF